jgi:hypothetical protein
LSFGKFWELPCCMRLFWTEGAPLLPVGGPPGGPFFQLVGRGAWHLSAKSACLIRPCPQIPKTTDKGTLKNPLARDRYKTTKLIIRNGFLHKVLNHFISSLILIAIDFG